MTGVVPQVAAPPTHEVDVPAQALYAAQRAAAHAQVDVDVVASQDDARAAVDVFATVWPQSDGRLPMTPELAWALAHAGNYVVLARRNGDVIGAAVAFRGKDDAGLHLHSHMTGLLASYQGGSIGFAIKQHQRAWALDQGIARVTWTFDPLVARNAYFNVMKLGATVTRYYPDFYGPLSDDVNAGDESDRCLATWQLDDARATAASTGDIPVVSLDDVRGAGGVTILETGDGGSPVRREPKGSTLLAQLPPDVVGLRAVAPKLAREWRLAVRSVLAPALADGFRMGAVTRDSWCVLVP